MHLCTSWKGNPWRDRVSFVAECDNRLQPELRSGGYIFQATTLLIRDWLLHNRKGRGMGGGIELQLQLDPPRRCRIHDMWSIIAWETVMCIYIFDFKLVYAGKVKTEDNVCYGPVNSKAQPAQEPVYEDPDSVSLQKVRIDENVAYGYMRQWLLHFDTYLVLMYTCCSGSSIFNLLLYWTQIAYEYLWMCVSVVSAVEKFVLVLVYMLYCLLTVVIVWMITRRSYRRTDIKYFQTAPPLSQNKQAEVFQWYNRTYAQPYQLTPYDAR